CTRAVWTSACADFGGRFAPGSGLLASPIAPAIGLRRLHPIQEANRLATFPRPGEISGRAAGHRYPLAGTFGLECALVRLAHRARVSAHQSFIQEIFDEQGWRLSFHCADRRADAGGTLRRA